MNGRKWVELAGKEMSDFGKEVADLLNDVFDGIYHASNEVFVTDFSKPRHVEFVHYDNGFATYDSDLLTRLVLLAHIRNIRVEIKGHTHHYLKIIFVRVDRSGFFADRHPTLAEAIGRLGKAQEVFPDHTMPCGHEARYAVDADEGTHYCSLCALEMSHKTHASALEEIDALHAQIDALVSKADLKL